MLQNALWIKSPVQIDSGCAEFYRTFTVNKEVAHASLTASAIGLYTPFLNGERITPDLLTPGWTEYSGRVQYQTYDVNLRRGENELCLLSGEGWAVGLIGHHHNKHYAGDHVSVIFSLTVTYTDGTAQEIVSDKESKVRSSQILFSQIYDGETVDRTAVREEYGAALEDDDKKPALVAQVGEAVREQERLRPVCMFTTPKGERVIDFGQNMSGYVEVKINGRRGDRIRISHAEVLDREGNFYTDNLRTAKEQNTYILSGEGTEVFKPTFSWQGFRYMRVDEYPGEIDLNVFTAVVIHSDIKRTGHFECGNAKINQLYHNVIWGQKSNYIDVPTDCPQRDERLGWTGDAQVFVRTAAINYDIERFFLKWMGDVALAQTEDGGITGFVPRVKVNDSFRISCAWADASVICPWEIYLAYGSDAILCAQFESMRKWIEYMHATGKEEFLWIGGTHYGDWLAMDAEDERGATPHDFIASVYFAHSTELFIKAGEVIGKDMTEYRALHVNIVRAVRDRFFAVGRSDLAYDLLFEERMPSWLYSVNHGATTMWEHWDGIKEDGTFWSSSMNSFNHYAYGAVYDWIFGVCAGVKCQEDGAGYHKVDIRPITDKRLAHLRASIETRHGLLSSAWYYSDGEIRFEFEIPEDTAAQITLPNGYTETVGAGKYNYGISL